LAREAVSVISYLAVRPFFADHQSIAEAAKRQSPSLAAASKFAQAQVKSPGADSCLCRNLGNLRLMFAIGLALRMAEKFRSYEVRRRLRRTLVCSPECRRHKSRANFSAEIRCPQSRQCRLWHNTPM
jgi:hypothetical protein